MLVFITIAALCYFITKNAIIFSLLTLLLLGMWQLISALVLSFYQKKMGYSKELKIYWIAAIVCLIFFFGGLYLKLQISKENAIAIAVVGMVGGFFTSFYYLYLYKKFIFSKNETPVTPEDLSSIN